MCTVSVIQLPGSCVRLVCNRDELRTRSAALPPVVRRSGERLAVMPIDPESGGTWIAANDAGLIFVLLNFNPATSPENIPRDTRSRGVIIPSLLHHSTLAGALQSAVDIDPRRHQPFRLVLIDPDHAAEIISNGMRNQVRLHADLREPLLFTSSGLGDHLVERPRRELFDETVKLEPTPLQQDQFHQHQWPDRPHLSVRMRRHDARTVSRTIVELEAGRIRLTYLPEPSPRLPPWMMSDQDLPAMHI